MQSNRGIKSLSVLWIESPSIPGSLYRYKISAIPHRKWFLRSVNCALCEFSSSLTGHTIHSAERCVKWMCTYRTELVCAEKERERKRTKFSEERERESQKNYSHLNPEWFSNQIRLYNFVIMQPERQTIYSIQWILAASVEWERESESEWCAIVDVQSV